MAYFEANPGDYSPTQTTNGAARYGKYQLPGGTNYREVLLTLPVKSKWASYDSAGNLKLWIDGEPTQAQKDAAAIAGGYLQRTMLTDAAGTFKSGHWDEPNILAHIRVNDRTDSEGKRVLFIEEIQSDWGQEGKRKGFTSAANPMKVWKIIDANGDGVNELATFTQATTATDPSQIAVYFAAADRVNGDPVAEPYRIRPLAVTIAGGVATIKGDAWLFVAPILSEGFDVQTDDFEYFNELVR